MNGRRWIVVLVGALLLGGHMGSEALAGKGGGGKGGGQPGDGGGGAPADAALAFAKPRKRGGVDLAVTDAAGSSVTTIVSNAGSLSVEADWSPDGTRIAFHGTIEGSGIYVVYADGSNLAKLTSTAEGYTSNVAWSPVAAKDGFYYILFDDDGGDGGMYGNSDLFAVRPDGTNRTNLTDTPGRSESCGVWSRDALQIAAVVAEHALGMPNDVLLLDLDLVDGRLTSGTEWNVTDLAGSLLQGQDVYHIDWARTKDVLAVAAVPPSESDADIFVLDLADPVSAWNLTLSAAAEERSPTWSSDDRHIAYWLPGGQAKVMSIASDGLSPPDSVVSGGISPSWKR